MDIVCVGIPISVLAWGARRINVDAMCRMFFNPSPVPVSVPVVPQKPRWVLFRICNWVFSLMFLLSFYSVVSTYNRQHRFLKLDAIICGLTMTYLIGFFGVSSIADADDSDESRTSTAAPSSASTAPSAETKGTEVNPPSPSSSSSSSSSSSCGDDCAKPVRSVSIDGDKTEKAAADSPASPQSAQPVDWSAHDGDTQWAMLLASAFVFSSVLMLASREPLTTVDLAQAVPSLVYREVLSPAIDIATDASSTIKSAVLILLGAFGYKLLFGPRRDGRLDSHDFNDNDSDQEKARAATYPAPYPNGWYKVADSSDLKRGGVIQVKALGQVLAVYRTNNKEGKACVLDAHCPHMGANLAIGGSVKDDCLECPFHLWQFNGEGKVTTIPYATKIPAVAKTRAWPTYEYMNMICIYYDAEGREPPYLPLAQPDVDSGRFPYRGKWNSRDIKMHLQEFAENSADFQHFQPLHGQMCVPWTSFKIPGLTIQHSAQWLPQKEEGRKHIALFKDHAYLNFFGRRIPKTDADATITFMGPGGICYFRFDIPDLGEILLVQTHTPLKAALQRTQFRWYADRKIPSFLVSYVVGNWITQWQNDIMVWENKIYSRKPLVVKGDGPILALRRWFRQFYSENSAGTGDDNQQELTW